MSPRKLAIRLTLVAAAFIVFMYACQKPDAFGENEVTEWFSGGKQTVFDQGAGAFSSGFNDMSEDKERLHEIGDLAFEATFVTAPNDHNPGLGPIFNSVSCTSCHIGDGRGKPPGPGESLVSMLFRISVPGSGPHNSPNPVPGFGSQLQQRAVWGKQPEGDVAINYSYQTHTFPDGEEYQMRTPNYTIVNPYTSLPGNVMVSPRIAPPVFGLGILEAIADADVLRNEDINDANSDGISGKANRVWDATAQTMRIGRFGWKAGQPTVIQQTAGAYNEDMGLANPIFPNESAWGQPQMLGMENDPHVSDSILHAVAFYIRTLAVPARRAVDDVDVKRGKALFTQIKCASCHAPMARTAVNVAFPEMSNLMVFPYTDLLLHDMGPGLADLRPEFDADGYEWRTSPLWGIGLTQVVNGHNNFLHDGRARSFIEAIMWHGGEAEGSKNSFYNLPKSDRDALVKFLESL